MVLLVMKYNIHPDKMDAYSKWIEGAIKRSLGVPGVGELRAYRPATGAFQIVATYEFADMAAWAAWQGHVDNQKNLAELHTFAHDVDIELWGPSPVVPTPSRPQN